MVETIAKHTQTTFAKIINMQNKFATGKTPTITTYIYSQTLLFQTRWDSLRTLIYPIIRYLGGKILEK